MKSLPAPQGMKWLPAVQGYCLHDGANKRAVIIPNRPRAWNGNARWTVDAVGLPEHKHALTLRQAVEIANANA